MKIIRRNEYIAVPVRPLRSGALSIRAKGMLMVLFSAGGQGHDGL